MFGFFRVLLLSEELSTAGLLLWRTVPVPSRPGCTGRILARRKTLRVGKLWRPISLHPDLASKQPLKQKMLSSPASVHRYHFRPRVRVDPARLSWAGTIGPRRGWRTSAWAALANELPARRACIPDPSAWRTLESLLLYSSLFDILFSSA